MKRLGALVCLILIAVTLLAPAMCFADTGLEITKTYPEGGQHNLQPINCGVKIWFNEPMVSAEYEAQNKACFQMVDAEGNPVDIQVLWSEKEDDLILVLAKDTLADKADYQLRISGDLTSAAGNTLGADTTIDFGTRDPSRDSLASIGLMAVMTVGVVVASIKSVSDKGGNKPGASSAGKDEKVNPYKVSKATGKSVSEIVEKTNKEKAKKAAAEAKKAAAQAKKEARAAEEKAEEEAVNNGNKRVHGPRPISAAGSTYSYGRKSRAEAAAEAARAKGTTNPKNKNKGKKKK